MEGKAEKRKTGIGYSPLSEKVYIGVQNPKKRMWVGEKRDITSDFMAVALEFFTAGTIREISRDKGSSNLLINIKNDKASIERLIKNLTKRMEKLKNPK